MWKCRCATHSEVWMRRMHQCIIIEQSEFNHIRSSFYTMILGSIIVSYIFTWVGSLHGHEISRLSNDIFNTWQIFISISILGSYYSPSVLQTLGWKFSPSSNPKAKVRRQNNSSIQTKLFLVHLDVPFKSLNNVD